MTKKSLTEQFKEDKSLIEYKTKSLVSIEEAEKMLSDLFDQLDTTTPGSEESNQISERIAKVMFNVQD